MSLRFFAKSALFVLLPLLLLEGLIRLGTPATFSGVEEVFDMHSELMAAADTGRVDIVFVGSSITAGAVETNVFAASLADSLDRPVVAVNLARGYSTPFSQLNILQRATTQFPDRFRHTTVLVEAAHDGVPLPELTGTPSNRRPLGHRWTDAWADAEWPELSSPYFTLETLGTYWLTSSDPAGIKARVTAAYFLHGARYWKFIRHKIQDVGDRIGHVLARPIADAPDEPSPTRPADLNPRVGLRADSAGIAFLREEATKRPAPSNRIALSAHWDRTILDSLVQVVRASGGTVAFYHVSTSPEYQATYRSNFRAQSLDRTTTAFQQWTAREDLPSVVPTFQYRDDDWPDLVHLRQSRAPDFSQALADAYLPLEKRSSPETDAQ